MRLADLYSAPEPVLATAAGCRLCLEEQIPEFRRREHIARRQPQALQPREADTSAHLAIHLIATVKPYLVSLLVGMLAGSIYALLRVRSPAPPVIALVGLLGMLAGEQGVGIGRALLWPQVTSASDVAAPASTSPASTLPGNRHAP